MTSDRSKAAFVLVHGAWHGAWSYERVIPSLARGGHAAVARDLPAHGLLARFPASYHARPFDPAAFATEPSPVSATTLQECADQVLSTIDEMRALGHKKVVLVGHSMGGVVITAAAEQAPEKIAHLVYLTAFMPAPGAPLLAYIQAPENAGELVGPSLAADPMVTGSLRLDPLSGDAAYRARLRQAFCGDVDDALFASIAHLLTPDAPLNLFTTPATATLERWGALPRHYIMCTEDQALRPRLQERFIAEADAFAPGNPTRVHRMATSHSPFFSAPERLAALLSDLAASS
jgi:pimeloyl-ACP methyl ester carboxylesterase